MKKVCIVLLAMVFAMGMAFTAQAANNVDVTTTSDPILVLPCEKTGSITFVFDAGTVLTAGDTSVPTSADWWVVDLPFGMSLCKPLNFEITHGGAGANFITENGTIAYGPVTITDIGADGVGNSGVDITDVGVRFLVQGNVGSQRVMITVIGGDNDGVADTLTVDTDARLGIKLFDSVTYAIGPGSFAWEDTDGNGVYGEDGAVDQLEAVDNTMCVNTTSIVGNLVNVSYDSRDDFINFTGDNEVGHRVSAASYSLEGCKAGVVGEIDLTLVQGTVCNFDYESATGQYCPATVGNRAIIQNNSGFFENTAYQVRLTITSPADGVYWGGVPGAADTRISDFATVDHRDCSSLGTNVAGETPWAAYQVNGVTPVTVFDAGTCTVAASSRATVLESNVNGFTDLLLPASNQIFVNMPVFVFDSSMVNAGETVTVKVELIKVPCTVVFTGNVDVGVFVDQCGVAAGSSFTFPYFPAMLEPAALGWWSGYSLSNCSSTDAECTLTFYEQDGDIGTLDQDVPAAGLVFGLFSGIAGSITLDAGSSGSGTIGDSAFFLCVTCTGSSSVKGFGMLGDGQQAQGMAVGPSCP